MGVSCRLPGPCFSLAAIYFVILFLAAWPQLAVWGGPHSPQSEILVCEFSQSD